MGSERIQYVVKEKTMEVPGVTTLFLTDEQDNVPPFTPGQYITVYFPELSTPEGKAYSISSAPRESTFSITVRNIGEFSGRLCSISPGETLLASLPYGFLKPQ